VAVNKMSRNTLRRSAQPGQARPEKIVGAGLPRWVELPLALAGLALAAPIVGLASFVIVLTSPGPALFRQHRVGRGGRKFVMYKLRTMQQGNSGPQVTAAGDPRITPVGAVLRRSKLDELPELWNVVRGDMSLLGPRPELPRYVDLDNPLWQIIVQARPGITDPVTVRLRKEEELLGAVDGDRERFYREELQPYKLIGYVEYLESRSWRSDLRLLLETVLAILRPESTPVPTPQQIRECVGGYSKRYAEDDTRVPWQLQRN